MLRIGLIGAGPMGLRHIAACRVCPQAARITAVCDVRVEAVERAARELTDSGQMSSDGKALTPALSQGEREKISLYIDPLRLLREGPIDAVIIATPNTEHAALAIAAAGAGKHVMVEKPMACAMGDCHAMVLAAKQAGVVLMAAQNQRYKPTFRAIRNAIAAGRIGQVRCIRMEAALDVLKDAPQDHWVYDRQRGGGVMLAFAVHRLDLARFLVGEIHRVDAVLRRTHPHFAPGTDDWAMANMEFAAGATGHILATFHADGQGEGESLEIVGERGTITASRGSVRSNEPAILRLHGRAPEELVAKQDGLAGDDMFAHQIAHFAECCRTGREPISSGRDNLGTMQAVFQALSKSSPT